MLNRSSSTPAPSSSYRPLGALALLLLLLLPGCHEQAKKNTTAAAETRFVVPELKPRPAGLADAEFEKIKGRFDILRNKVGADSNATEAYVGLAQIYMHEARVTGDHPYYFPAAERTLDEALRRKPDDLAALISKGSVLLSLHHFAEALQVGERARTLAPSTAVVYGILCDANVELGRYKEAVEAADMMASIRPDLRSYSRVSYLREIHGDDTGAISAMKMAVSAGAPGLEETEWARYMLGMLRMRSGDVTGAEREFLMALAERPGYPFALSGVARVRAAQGRNDEALALLDSAMRFIPEFSFVEMKADIYRATGANRQADSLITVVEGMLAEDEAAGHLADKEFALLYANHNIKSAEAENRARKELAARPDNIEAQHAYALTLLRAGDAAGAREYLAKALRMGTKDPVVIAHAGLAEAKLGNKDVARTQLRRALSIDPYLSPLLLAEVRKTLSTM